MLKILIENSIFVLLLKKLGKGYYYVEQWLDQTYKNSQINKIIKKIRNGLKVCFIYSFLSKISGINEEKDITILDQSIFIQWIINLYKKWRQKLIFYLKSSKIYSLEEQLRKEFYSLPVKTISIIVTVTVVTNIFFSIFLRKEIGLLGWILRGLFLFIGLTGIFCNANWQGLKKTSLVLRYLERKI